MRGPAVVRLRLTDFRSYPTLDLSGFARLTALVGPNGAGKTNILEALSLLTPGRGLRRAALAAMPRTGASGGFAVLADLDRPDGDVLLATALGPGETARQCRIDREPVASANRFLDHLAMLWLTPDQDGLFRGAPGDRRRFLDRLVLAVDAAHGTRSNAYEAAMRHRNRLLEEPGADPRWLDAIETEMAEAGVAIAAARRETVTRLSALLATEAGASLFPHARVSIEGEIEARLSGSSAIEVEDAFRRLLREGRGRDRAAGRALVGPQASDLLVVHGPKNEPAASCSTGEQKALLIGLVLTQARLIAQMRGAPPLILLDEVAAHLDAARRAGLYALLDRLGAQVVMTGTDASLFEALPDAGLVFRIGGSGTDPVRSTGM